MVSSVYQFYYIGPATFNQLPETILLNLVLSTKISLEIKFSSQAFLTFQISRISRIFCFLYKVNGCKKVIDSSSQEDKEMNSTKDCYFWSHKLMDS